MSPAMPSAHLIDPYTGGKKFSKNLTPLDADGNPTSMWGVNWPMSLSAGNTI